MGTVLSINLPNTITVLVMVALGYLGAVVLYQVLGRAVGSGSNGGPGGPVFALFGSALNRNAQ